MYWSSVKCQVTNESQPQQPAYIPVEYVLIVTIRNQNIYNVLLNSNIKKHIHNIISVIGMELSHHSTQIML